MATPAGGVSLVKFHSLGAESVEVRRLMKVAAKATQVAPAKVVGEEEGDAPQEDTQPKSDDPDDTN